MAKSRAKAAQASVPVGDFEPDAFCIRTTDRDGRAYGGFEWDRTVGAIVAAPDWNPAPICGGGLHGNLDGVQDWSLQSDAHDALWWIVGVRRDECVAIDADKVKFPRCKVVYVGVMAEAMRLIAQQWRRVALEAQEGAKTSGAEAHASTTGDWAHASTTGAEAHASTTGAEAHASTTGGRAHASTTGAEAHASTTGDWAHASTTGDWAHASTTGAEAHASTTGGRNAVAVSLGRDATGQAAAGGWFVLTARDDDGEIVLVKAFQAGADGVEADTPYRLLADGTVERAEIV